jgi:cobyrinic acid a,c-diamide synthase
MRERRPRIVIAGMGGDSGKTLLSLGLLSSWRRDGLRIASFKKGPDYIDAAWLSRLSGTVCRNLDTFLMGETEVQSSFLTHSRDVDVALVEGNRGLFDGIDARGRHSSAELAKLIDAPVLLVLGVRKVTRTVAASLLGCRTLDPDLPIAGVVLNRVAGARHEKVVRESVESICGIQVIGALPVLSEGGLLPDRHLGLVTPAENDRVSEMEERLAGIIAQYVDCAAVLEMARAAPLVDLSAAAGRVGAAGQSRAGEGVCIGYFSDSAFTFYYPENLEALTALGARLVPISSLQPGQLPADIHALYIGGGFPETHASRIAGNGELLESVAQAVDQGLPVYAECGGLIYLAETLKWQGREYRMAGVLPVTVELDERPAGHGYCRVAVDGENPFFPVGMELTGHEFHYSRVVEQGGDAGTVFRIVRGTGARQGRGGLVRKNVLATYLHLHARGTPAWARGVVRAAQRFRGSGWQPADV